MDNLGTALHALGEHDDAVVFHNAIDVEPARTRRKTKALQQTVSNDEADRAPLERQWHGASTWHQRCGAESDTAPRLDGTCLERRPTRIGAATGTIQTLRASCTYSKKKTSTDRHGKDDDSFSSTTRNGTRNFPDSTARALLIFCARRRRNRRFRRR